MADLQDALTRAMHSSWWEWLYDSRLFLWSWVYLLMKEYIDSSRVFHLDFTLPKVKLYAPPIKEEWI